MIKEVRNPPQEELIKQSAMNRHFKCRKDQEEGEKRKNTLFINSLSKK